MRSRRSSHQNPMRRDVLAEGEPRPRNCSCGAGTTWVRPRGSSRIASARLLPTSEVSLRVFQLLRICRLKALELTLMHAPSHLPTSPRVGSRASTMGCEVERFPERSSGTDELGELQIVVITRINDLVYGKEDSHPPAHAHGGLT